jgi:hypothetical protein
MFIVNRDCVLLASSLCFSNRINDPDPYCSVSSYVLLEYIIHQEFGYIFK